MSRKLLKLNSIPKIMSKRKANLSIKNKTSEPRIEIETDHSSNETVSKYFVIESRKPIRKRTHIEIKYENDQKSPKDPETKKRQLPETVEAGNHDGDKWVPNNWQKTLDLIKEMRKDNTAPVDQMGCHKCSDKKASPPVFRFQSLLALMLSSQTKDQVTHSAMERLKNYGCTPHILHQTPDNVLEKLIYPVSFYKRKVQYIKNTCEVLLREYKGDIPDTIEGLCSLPGVGPKMGHICMQVAWNQVTGIGVDTHVHRICNRLKWVKKEAKTPEETRKQLEEWLPKELWTELNYLFVGFGQEICLPQHPKCGQCLNKSLCPFANA
ncbi:endonuclease III-like protein 1 [Fopius arisanus]|uniref:Endonuclease III homolog n=1 Tax=Fopius arisanus TaxID=64838 RepID=A0A0C9Q7G9_9HYME|nr:PREDICTED: endonuclease III-like protein 1 [Fopius arisanus]